MICAFRLVLRRIIILCRSSMVISIIHRGIVIVRFMPLIFATPFLNLILPQIKLRGVRKDRLRADRPEYFCGSASDSGSGIEDGYFAT